MEGMTFADPAGLICVENDAHRGQASTAHHEKSASQIRVCIPVWWWDEKRFRLVQTLDPTHMKIADFLVPMIESNGVPIPGKVVQMQHVYLTFRKFVAMLRMVLHEHGALFHGSPRERLQDVGLDHHIG